MLGGSFELLRQRVAASDNAWQLRYQAESKLAREEIITSCKILATCLLQMRPARHHSAVHQEESYAAAELGGRAKPDKLVCKATAFVCYSVP